MSGTEEEQAAAVLAALNAADAAAYDAEELKKLPNLPESYTEVTVTRRFGGQKRSTGDTGRTGWRITTRAVGKFVSNAREMRHRSHTALESARLIVSGETSTAVQFETAEDIGDDDGWYSGLTTWTYTV